jgi:serine/tyrosine/threonine adenylyltransferase
MPRSARPSTTWSPPRRSRAPSCASATTAGPRASASASSARAAGSRISAGSSRCPAASSDRSRCATTATSSAPTTPRSATAAAFLYAQLRDTVDGRLLDLGTKGSGQTPWSRTGDGRLTLKGGVRELLATEMLEALGVYTSKTFSLIETGEALIRGDEPSPTRSAVLVRLGHSHIRIGTFQRLAVLGQLDDMRRLVDHCIEHFWPEAAAAPDPVAGLYDAILGATARMGAEWFAAGFVHGVLNTDNTNITGESFDYGPWRFLDRFEPGFTAAYFDQTGLYAFARQPEALNWNLARLGECLIPLSDRSRIEPVFDSFADRFQTALARQTLGRLGLTPPADDAAAIALTHAFWGAMQATRAPFQRVFFDLIGGGLPDRLRASPERPMYETAAWAEVIEDLRGLDPAPDLACALGHGYFTEAAPETMVIDEVEAIWAAIDTADDWAPLHDKVERVRRMGEAHGALGLLDGPLARPGHVRA